MNQVDIYTTVIGGAESSEAVEKSAGKLGFESAQTRPPGRFEIELVDFPFTDPEATFEDHLAVVADEQPEVAVAPDVDQSRDPETVYDQADRLAEHADAVVIVPKAIHPSEIPDRFRVGVPLANWEKRGAEDPTDWVDPTGQPQFHQWTEYQDAEEVHLLGGSPTVQLEASKYHLSVASVDGSSIFQAAAFGDVWTSEGWQSAHPDVNDYYQLVRKSLDNMAVAWADRYGYNSGVKGGEWFPHPPEPTATKQPYNPDRELEARLDRGPPTIDADELDTLAPDERQEFETVDWAGAMNEREVQATNQRAVATDGGRDMRKDSNTYDPTEEWTDDRPQQDTLVDESTRASADTDSRIDEGASDEFADDRNTDKEAESGTQASLTGTTHEGQASLTGGTATTDPEWKPPEQADSWEDAFDVDEGKEAPDFVGDWELVDSYQNNLTYEAGPYQVELKEGADGDATVWLENLEGVAEHPVVKLASFAAPGPTGYDNPVRQGREFIRNYIIENEPEDVTEDLPDWAQKKEGDTERDQADDTTEYDPLDEYDELEERSGVSTMGNSRRKTLDAIKEKGRLDTVQSFKSLEEMKNAVREISLAYRNGMVYMGPDEDVLTALDWTYNDLPEEAQQAYLNDDTLHRRINAARNQFNDWMGKKKREQEIPSPMEAGPANYPVKKARDTSRYAREASDDLSDRLYKVKAGAKGARQRALESIGSSVAEHNAEKDKQDAQSMKEKLEPGDIVLYRTTRYGVVPWGVKRLNKKSARLRRPHQSAGMKKPMSDGETYPEYDETTTDYESRFLTHLPRDEIDDIDPDEIDADTEDIEAIAEGYEPGIRYLMGDDWVEDNIEHVTGEAESVAPEIDEPGFSDKELRAIEDHAKNGRMKELLSAIGATSNQATLRDWSDAGIKTPKELVDHYDERGNFESVRYVGPATSEDIEPAVPTIREAIETQEAEEVSISDWSTALENLRANYGDGYGERVSLGSNMAKHANQEAIELPEEAGSEAVLQPIIRYQDIDPVDVRNQIENKVGEDTAAKVYEAVTSYGLTLDAPESDGSEFYTLRSPNRPIPLSAKQDLEEFGIVKELDSTDDLGHGEGVVLEELPPEDLRDRWELRVEQEPTVVFEDPQGYEAKIYTDPDKVIAGGTEATLSPREAVEKANEKDWEVIEGDPHEIVTGHGVGEDITGEKPEVGNHLWITFENDGGMGATVTRIDGDEALLRVSDAQAADRYNWEKLTVETSKGRTENVAVVELQEENAENFEQPDDDTSKYEAPDDDGLADHLVSMDINRVTANHLADQYDNIREVDKAVQDADDVTNLKGVGKASKDEVLEAFPSYNSQEGDDYQGEYKNKRMENAHYWAAQLLGWMKEGPNAGLRGTYYVDIIGGKPVLVMSPEKWDYDKAKTIKDALRDEDFPQPIRINEGDDATRLFISEPTDDRLVTDWHPEGWRSFEATGGHQGDIEGKFKSDQLGTWDYPGPWEDIEDTDESADYIQPENPQNPRTDGEAAAQLRVGKTTWPLPAPWDDWDDMVVGSPQFTGDDRPDDEGTHVVYLNYDRDVALRVQGTEGGNKWSMKAERYPEPMPENPTDQEIQFGPDMDATERKRLTHGNTASAEAWSEFEDNAVNVRTAREIVTEPGARPAPETLYDPLDDSENYLGEKGRSTYGLKPADVTVDKRELSGTPVSPDDLTIAWDDEREPTYSAQDEAEQAGVDPDTLFDPMASTSEPEPEPKDPHVEVEFSRWDMSVLRTALNRAENQGHLHMEDLPDTISSALHDTDEGETATLTIMRPEAQLAADSLEDYKANTPPGQSIMGDNDEEIARMESALSALEDAGITGEPWSEEVDREADDIDGTEVIEHVETGDREEFRFGTLDAANEWRDANEEHLCSQDNRSTKTVILSPSAPESARQSAGEAALVSEKQDKTYGQAELTDAERRQLENRSGWEWHSHGFHAEASKAVLLEEGGTPWLDYYDHTLDTAKEHISLIERGRDMAVQEGVTSPGEMNLDQTTEEEIGNKLEKARTGQCKSARNACETGEPEACRSLLEDCGWSQDEIDDLLDATRAIGEDPDTIYDPVAEQQEATETRETPDIAFEDWAAEMAPEKPPEPTDDELAEIAPTKQPDELRPEALRALKKAWSGYKIARADDRQAHREMEKYAGIINGVRAVNGQDPIDFDGTRWEGGEVLPDDPDEEFIGPSGEQKTLADAAKKGILSTATTVQSTLQTYDPTGEF